MVKIPLIKYGIPSTLIFLLIYAPYVKEFVVSRDCVFEEWGEWSPCLQFCGPSWKVRRRQHEVEAEGFGKPCEGEILEKRSCVERPCPVDGRPGSWSQWSDCDRNCREGKMTRTRKCNSPPAQHFGKECNADELVEYKSCPSTTPCVIDGVAGVWGNWGACSTTCGEEGVISRERGCIPPKNGGRNCKKEDLIEVRTCVEPVMSRLCKRDGVMSEWEEWGECNDSCNRTRTRECLPPKGGGLPCQGEITQVEKCVLPPCNKPLR